MEVLGIDVGGSGIKGAIVETETGTMITERHRIETPQPATPTEVANVVKRLVDHFEWKGNIGIGFPSVVQQGIIHTASNISDEWIGVNAEELFTDITECKATVVNDADAAGLAEMIYGSGKGLKGVVLLITIGTGIGSSLFSNGHLVPNTELGHIPLHGDVAEKYASDAARKRDDLSWKKWGKRFNEYLELVWALIRPEHILLGGGASKKFEKYEKYLTVDSKVTPAELLNQAGIIGAAYAGLGKEL